MRVLVVGGQGFLGRHAAAALAERAGAIAVFDRPGSGEAHRPGAPSLPAGCEQYAGSVTSMSDIAEAAAVFHPDVIVSLASLGLADLGLVPSAEQDPRGAIDVNVGGLLNVLEVASARRGTRVVWTSSTTVYGQESRYAEPFVDENGLLAPRSIYAATKVLGEQLVRSYRASGAVEGVALRPTLVWGPGIRYRGVQSGLSEMVEATAAGRFGVVHDSDEVWDLLYVRDAGRAVAWLAHLPEPPETILVNGYRASIRDAHAALLAERPDARIELRGQALRLGFPHVDDRAARETGFTPAYGLRCSIADYLETAKGHDAGPGRTP